MRSSIPCSTDLRERPRMKSPNILHGISTIYPRRCGLSLSGVMSAYKRGQNPAAYRSVIFFDWACLQGREHDRSHWKARVHRPVWRHGCSLAARGARAAAGNAGDRAPRPKIARQLADRLREFRQGLKEIGYVEGEYVVIEYRWAEGQYDRLPELAAELVRRQVSVIATTGGHPAAFTAKAATTTIPVVFIASDDPVKLGLVASLARPGGNLTGINFLSGELTAKRLELFHELVTAAARVGVLVNPANAVNVEATLREVGVAARAIGLQVQIVNASTIREMNAAFTTFVRERADAVF